MRVLLWLLTLATTTDHRLWGRLFGPAPPTIEPVKVSVRALARVWAEVRVDGDAQYSGWMEEGRQLRLEGRQEVYVWCGQADKLALSVNGEGAGTLATLTNTPSRAPAWYTFRADAPLHP